MTMGMIMHYGGAVGAVLGIILELILSKVFAVQRRRMRNEIGSIES